MAHLIAPIWIDGAFRCPKGTGEGSGGVDIPLLSGVRVITDGIETADVIAGPNTADLSTNAWTLVYNATGANNEEGEITFGVACGSTVTLELVAENEEVEYQVDVIEAGVITSTTGGNLTAGTSVSIALSVAPDACGSKIRVSAIIYDSTFGSGTFPAYGTMKILSVT
jgi:hypothetical protein